MENGELRIENSELRTDTSEGAGCGGSLRAGTGIFIVADGDSMRVTPVKSKT
jgi:hypothetical protein